ncbi:MAG: coniferyl aldehyde dehydrogenase [Pseudomonadota bacterium]
MDGGATTDLRARFDAVRAASRAEPFPDLALRTDRIRRIEAMTLANQRRIADAIAADFSARSPVETELAEIMTVLSAARDARRHLKDWMRVRPADTALHFKPLKNWLMPQPLGVIGIIAPWNYPYNLSLTPMVAAFAAGNRAMLKPSESVPATSELLRELIAERFDADEATVITGGVETGTAFARLPFDHLFFTGSPKVGRMVALAAADSLTPVTLELGGKSPAIIDESADMDQAIPHIAFAKTFNAGQTCIAVDYALVPSGRIAEFTEKLSARISKMYPSVDGNPDYTAQISDRQHARMQELLTEAEAGGATLTRPVPDGAGRVMAPVIVTNPPAGCALLTEEIFGPIMPVLPCETVDAAIDHVNAGERPLALYWFGRDRSAEKRILEETWAGGVTINDCLVQVAQESLPFGGVGQSGQGHYHGRYGFETFSKLKPVTKRPRGPDGTLLLHAPYGMTARGMIAAIKRLV